MLRLWTAARFWEHSASPIRISPVGARMGGAVARTQGKLLRFRLGLLPQLGAGLAVFEVQRLTLTLDYELVVFNF